jgi:hypothetical protein
MRPGTGTPPLGGSACPDPLWGTGARAFMVVGPWTFAGPRWVMLLSDEGTGEAPLPPPVPSPIPPPATEGAILYLDDLETPEP